MGYQKHPPPHQHASFLCVAVFVRLAPQKKSTPPHPRKHTSSPLNELSAKLELRMRPVPKTITPLPVQPATWASANKRLPPAWTWRPLLYRPLMHLTCTCSARSRPPLFTVTVARRWLSEA